MYLKCYLAYAILLCIIFNNAFAQNTNLTLRSLMPFNHASNEELSDVWHYKHSNGKEYAIVGTTHGTSIVDVSNPDAVNEVFWLSGSYTYWRDPQVWKNYAYIVNEASGGLQIINLSNLPNINTTTDVKYYTGGLYNGNTISFSTAHDIFIDEHGIAYVVGANYGIGGAIMLNVEANPTNPPIVGIYNTRYVHDCFVRNDTMWAAEINNGVFSIVNVSNKANPIVMAMQATAGGATHNTAITNDGKTLFTTDEDTGTKILAWDVSDITDIKQIGDFRSNPGSNVIPHNAYYLNNFLYISYYRDGVVVVDVSHPEKMVQVANYDTSPNYSGNGYNGCWGVTPFLPSGLILASDIEEGLYVLSANLQHACFVNGLVTNSITNAVLNGVTITVSPTATLNTTTDISGKYIIGTTTPGAYTLTYSKTGYISQTINVTLSNNSTLVQNIALTPNAPFTLSGSINNNTNPISNANVLVSDGVNNYTASTNASGNFSISLPGSGNFNITVGKWGYISQYIVNQNFSPTNNNIVINLEKGYYDDFAFDFGWTVSSTTTSGVWVKGEPYGTFSSSVACNPELDISTDIGDQCFITGNANSTNASTDDVDNGSTVLSSPVFDLTGYTSAQLNYYRWFANLGGSGTPNDNLIIKISNGTITVTLDTVSNNEQESQWVGHSYLLENYLPLTSNMKFIADIGDIGTQHLVEGGIDGFSVINLTPAPTPKVTFKATVALQGAFNVTLMNMNTTLKSNNIIPITQPYNTSPWNYTGNENVTTLNDIPTNAVDWVLVEARDSANINQILETKACFLLSNGLLQDIDGTDGVNFTTLTNGKGYYFVIRHRNHIAIVSNNVVVVPNTSTFNFTAVNNVKNGANQTKQLINNIYGMTSGDINADGIISVSDFNILTNQISMNGYLPADITLDRQVTVADYNKYSPNASFIGLSLIRY